MPVFFVLCTMCCSLKSYCNVMEYLNRYKPHPGARFGNVRNNQDMPRHQNLYPEAIPGPIQSRNKCNKSI